MYPKEGLKKTFETVTGIGKPSAHAVEARVRSHKPDATMFADDGAIPNNPRLSFILYRGAVDLSNCSDPAAVFEELFKSNGWGNSWRNGIYGFVFYTWGVRRELPMAELKNYSKFKDHMLERPAVRRVVEDEKVKL